MVGPQKKMNLFADSLRYVKNLVFKSESHATPGESVVHGIWKAWNINLAIGVMGSVSM